MKREYLIFFLLIGFSAVNTVIHFTHPAYKYYKQNISLVENRLNERQEKFEKKILADLLPAIYQSISNSYRVVKADASASQSPYISISPEVKNERRALKQLDASFYLFRGVPCIEYNGITFKVGDNFDGSAITCVSPMMVRTELADYEIKVKPRSFGSERIIVNETN